MKSFPNIERLSLQIGCFEHLISRTPFIDTILFHQSTALNPNMCIVGSPICGLGLMQNLA